MARIAAGGGGKTKKPSSDDKKATLTGTKSGSGQKLTGSQALDAPRASAPGTYSSTETAKMAARAAVQAKRQAIREKKQERREVQRERKQDRRENRRERAQDRRIKAKKSGRDQSGGRGTRPDSGKQTILQREGTRSALTGRKLTGSQALDAPSASSKDVYRSPQSQQNRKEDRKDARRDTGGGRSSGGVRGGGGGRRGSVYSGSGVPSRDSEKFFQNRDIKSSGGSTFDGSKPGLDAIRNDYTAGAGGRQPPNFEGGAAGAGGGQTGGATNPLAAGVGEALAGYSLDEVLHGAKRKGRIRRTRGTE